MKLIIGNKRLSSWSLRPWLIMKHFNIHFAEILIPLDQAETREQILKYSPSGKVPALVEGSLHIHDSLAIAEYLNEKFPEKQMWPKDANWRAQARAISCEMHSGFSDMRRILSHDLQKELKDFDYSQAQADIDRVQQIWKECLKKSKGPFLFGDFSIADAMYAPVVNRFISYGVKYDSELDAYIKNIRNLPAHQEWITAGMKETYLAPLHT
jgi:glutathione S-transferase